MLSTKRRLRVLEIIRQQGGATLRDLADALDSSPSTIRRDIEHLSQQGQVIKTHGGALPLDTRLTTFEPKRDVVEGLSRAVKLAIGIAAAALVEPGQSLFFDSGSTTLAAARQVLKKDLNLTVVTNDLRIADVLTARGNHHVIVTGGTVRPGSPTLLGTPGLPFVQDLFVDIAFIGAHAVDANGLSETSLEVADIKRSIIRAARRVVLLADSSKFEQRAFYAVGSLSLLHDLISDGGLVQSSRSALEQQGVELRLVNVEVEGDA